LSEEGKKKQAKIRELQTIAEKLNCTLAQLSIGLILPLKIYNHSEYI
jgi:hypothetical protein